jgi:hypothetical protein
MEYWSVGSFFYAFFHYSNTPPLHHSNVFLIPVLHHSITPMFFNPTTPLLHHSSVILLTPLLHYSITPPLQYSTTPSLHCSMPI